MFPIAPCRCPCFPLLKGTCLEQWHSCDRRGLGRQYYVRLKACHRTSIATKSCLLPRTRRYRNLQSTLPARSFALSFFPSFILVLNESPSRTVLKGPPGTHWANPY